MALLAGASVVWAAGGYATVRTVAEVLAGTRVPMALLPLGTGNLLARNLDLPLESTELLIHTALGGTDHSIDLGWLRVAATDRKSTRLNSSHVAISYAVFCLKKKKTHHNNTHRHAIISTRHR